MEVEYGGKPSIRLSDKIFNCTELSPSQIDINHGGKAISIWATDKIAAIRINGEKIKNSVFIGSFGGEGKIELGNSKGVVPSLYMSGGGDDDSGGDLRICNKTGEEIIQLRADEYGNGYIGAFNRKGEGRVLRPGP